MTAINFRLRSIPAAWLVIYCSPVLCAFVWPRDLNSTPAANTTDIGTIKALVGSVLASGPVTDLMGVGEFRFVPLETVDRIDLIASVAISGQGGMNSVIAIWQTPEGGYGHALLPSDLQTALGRDVVDLSGRGVYEVIAGEFPGMYMGARTVGIPLYGIYSLQQGKWVDVSDKYPRVIEPWPENIARAVSEGCLSGDKALIERYRAHALYVGFETDRRVHHRSDPGALKAALEWADSSDESLRWLAMLTLEKIPDPSAGRALRKLAEDKEISAAVKIALRKWEALAGRK